MPVRAQARTGFVILQTRDCGQNCDHGDLRGPIGGHWNSTAAKNWTKVCIHSDSPPMSSDAPYKLILVEHSNQNRGNFLGAGGTLANEAMSIFIRKILWRRSFVLGPVLKRMKLWNTWAFFSVHCRSILSISFQCPAWGQNVNCFFSQ